MIEIAMAMLIGLIVTAIAIPQIQYGLYNYRLNSAISMATWAIQSTRFQALSKGYPFQVVFTVSTMNYQIQDLPSGSSTYANVVNGVPLTGARRVTVEVTLTNGANAAPISYQMSAIRQ